MKRRKLWLIGGFTLILLIILGGVIIANLDTPINSITDIQAAVNKLKSYRLTVDDQFNGITGYNKPTVSRHTMRASTFIPASGQAYPFTEWQYQAYVDVANGRIEQFGLQNTSDEIFIGSDYYIKQNGIWTKGTYGMSNIPRLRNIIVYYEERIPGATLQQLDDDYIYGLKYRVFAYSYPRQNMFQPSVHSTYYVGKDGVPRKVVHSNQGEQSSETITIIIDRINEPFTISAPEIK